MDRKKFSVAADSAESLVYDFIMPALNYRLSEFRGMQNNKLTVLIKYIRGLEERIKKLEVRND